MGPGRHLHTKVCTLVFRELPTESGVPPPMTHGEVCAPGHGSLTRPMIGERKSQMYSCLRRISSGCGWLLFGYEWVHVSYQTPRKEQLVFVMILVASLLLIHTSIHFWVAHNKRLAAQGKRGLITRYTSPVFLQDHLGRQLFLDERSLLSREIVVSINGDCKFYAAAPEG